MFKKIRFLDGFWIKVIAMVCMTFDHIGVYMEMFSPRTLQNVWTIFRSIGRIAFPLFVFLLVEGMVHTKNPKKYIWRITILALTVMTAHIAVLAFYALQGQRFSIGGNPIIELVCLSSMMYCLSLERFKKFYSLIPISYIVLSFIAQIEKLNWFPEFLRADYSLLGLLICLCFYVSRPILDSYGKKYQPADLSLDQFQLTEEYRSLLNLISCLSFFCLISLLWIIAKISAGTGGISFFDPFNISWESYCLIACLPILLYNGKRGYDSKEWRIFSYSYFPLHLVLICIFFVIKYGL